jgi:hypothetical protein
MYEKVCPSAGEGVSLLPVALCVAWNTRRGIRDQKWLNERVADRTREARTLLWRTIIARIF